MSTALTIIRRAMLKAGILTAGQSPTADEVSDALDTLNDLLASLSNDSLMIYARVTENFTLSAGVATYTIGAAQTFNTARPIFIAEAHVRSGTIDYDPMSIVSDEIYQAIPDKSSQGIPEILNYTNQYSTASINLYPAPAAGYTLYLTSEKELSQFTLNQTVSLPPGWNRFLIHELAKELAPEYGQTVDPSVVKIASEAKAAIARSVMKNRTMDAQPSGYAGGYNVLRGF